MIAENQSQILDISRIIEMMKTRKQEIARKFLECGNTDLLRLAPSVKSFLPTTRPNRGRATPRLVMHPAAQMMERRIYILFAVCTFVVAMRPTYRISLAPKGRLELRWSVDYEAKLVMFEIKAKLHKAEWMMVGFSDHGKSENADVILFYRDLEEQLHLRVSDVCLTAQSQ